MRASLLSGAMLAALMLTACGSIDRDLRIAEHAEQWKAFSPADQQRLKGGKVQRGDSMEAVLIALGEPTKKLFDPGKNLVIWRYDSGDASALVTSDPAIPATEEDSTVLVAYFDAASLQQQAELKQSDADHRRALADIHDSSAASRPVAIQAMAAPTFVVFRGGVVVMTAVPR